MWTPKKYREKHTFVKEINSDLMWVINVQKILVVIVQEFILRVYLTERTLDEDKGFLLKTFNWAQITNLSAGTKFRRKNKSKLCF